MNEILIKADELTTLVNYLNEIPHKYAREILGFLSTVADKRKEEDEQKQDLEVKKPLSLKAERKEKV